MRYNPNDTTEMATRLLYLVECFGYAVAEPNNPNTYTGPKVDASKSLYGQVRGQDFVPHDLAPMNVERISKDLIAKATANGELDKFVPVLTQAAEQYKAIPKYADPAQAPTLMQYALA